MANLPPRPVFTNLRNAAPNYNGRRNSNQPSSTNSGNPPSSRHYHPYARRSSTPAQGSPIPPWRRDRARQNRRSGPLGPPEHHHPHQGANPFAARTGDTCSPSTTNTNAGRPQQRTVYQSGPVMYDASVPSPQPPNTPRATGPARHAFGSAASTARGGDDMAGPPHPIATNISRPTNPFRPSNPAPATAVKGSTETPKPPRCPPAPAATTPTPSAAARPPPPPPKTSTPVPPVAVPVSVTATLGDATRILTLPARLLPNFAAWPQLPPHGVDVVVAVVGVVGAGAGARPPSTTTNAPTAAPPRRPVILAHPADPSPSTTTTTTTALLPCDNNDHDHHNHNHHQLHITLTPRAPLLAVMSVGECEAALDAVGVLVRVMVQHGPGVEGVGVNVDVLWRLAGLKEALGLVPGWVAWLRRCMGRFVSSRLGEVPGVVGGWEGVIVGAAGAMEDGEMLERALGVCAAFGWVAEARAVMKRATYVWRVGDDGEGLMKPDGGRVDVAICGKAAANAILAARGQVLKHVFTATQQSLYKWTVGIGNRPCRNITCNTHRIAALNTFLLWSGLYPRTKLNKSLREIISALQYITATDAELVAVAIEQGHADSHVCERLAWAARIREIYGGTCTTCDEKTATSTLFPLQDLLCDLTLSCRTTWRKTTSLIDVKRLLC